MPRTIEQRFESHVDRSAGTDHCHLWRGSVGGSGSPCLSVCIKGKRTSRSVRRIAWAMAFGPVPDGHQVMTTCQTKLCVNHKHLHLRSLDPINVFWQSVEKRGDGCWIWTGETGTRGYGMFEKGRVRMRAHRYSWELHNGPIPTDDGEWCVCHKCDTPKCVNPDHLFLGRDADNAADMVRKGRQAKGPTIAAGKAAARERRLSARQMPLEMS
jgi:hypothetical protein